MIIKNDTIKRFLSKAGFAYCIVETLFITFYTGLYFAKEPRLRAILAIIDGKMAYFKALFGSLIYSILVTIAMDVPAIYPIICFKKWGRKILKQKKGKVLCAILIIQLIVCIIGIASHVHF